MGKNSASTAPVVVSFLAFFMCGGILAVPGVIVDKLLAAWNWNMTTFGLGIFLQGVAALVGTRSAAAFLEAQGPRTQESNATASPLRRCWLPACSGTAGALGVLCLYFLNLPWLGFGLLGWAVGTYTVLGNVTALKVPSSARTLTFINTAFTGGAVVLPALTALLLTGSVPELISQILDFAGHNPDSPWWKNPGTVTWRITPALTVIAFVALIGPSAWYLASPSGHPQAAPVPPTPTAAAASNPSPRPQSPRKERALWASIALACYVGTEINLSNNWMPFLGSVGAPEAIIRLANPVYWLGLLTARLGFSLLHPHASAILGWLCSLGYLSLTCIGSVIAVALAMDSSLATWGIFLAARETLSPWTVLFPCFLSGLLIGAFYSFILGAVSYVQPSASVTATMHWGVLGAIALPPLMGFVAEHLGYLPAMGFVALTLAVFTAAVGIWRWQTRTRQKMSLESEVPKR